jgi:hypothetical protein
MSANTLVIPNEGKPDLLRYQIISSISGINPWSLRLYKNDFGPPTESMVLSDLTEASFSGYAAVTMTRSDWTSPVIVDDHARSTWKTVATIWICVSSGETIYGCYYTDDDLNVLRGVFKFDAPVDVEPGGVIAVLPEFSYGTEVVPDPPPPPPP